MTEKTIIYVLDADRMSTKVLEKMLEETFEVKSFYEPEKFIKALDEKLPEVILIDSLIYDCNNEIISKALAVSDEVTNIPLILITTEGDVVLTDNLKKNKYADYITKPFHKKIIKQRIEHTLEFTKLRQSLQRPYVQSSDTITLTNRDLGEMKDWPDFFTAIHQEHDINSEFQESTASKPGAIPVDYVVFKKLFEFVKNIQVRYQQDIQMALLTVEVRRCDNPNEELDKEINKTICNAIRNSIRNVDIFTRSGDHQYLILLMNVRAINIPNVMKRVQDNFHEKYMTQDYEMKYSVKEI
ncbi:MAG: response regulator [Eubacterium sp.]|nr:response regulator [Eubacterium sp.]